jgi:hypothetical protein
MFTNKYSYIVVGCMVIIVCAIILLYASFQGQPFKVDNLNYIISPTGDATVIADYHLSLVEDIMLTLPTVKDDIGGIIKAEYGSDSNITSITYSQTQFTIPKFATTSGRNIQTPLLNFEHVKTRVDSHWFLKNLNINYAPMVTKITSPTGIEYNYENTTTIPAMTLHY